ncbi:MAG: RT0821/Lpp0805 family surface protein [Myxococcota bacterium]|nr:RT0821/Lpp0805 family surface protein [Myxococcota bacterium]
MRLRRLRLVVAVLAIASCTTACVGVAGPGPRTQLAAAAGAAGGGLLGAALGGESEGILAGMLLGGLLGGAVGGVLDDLDRRHADQTLHYGLEYTPSGTTTRWRNPDSGHAGSITPIRTYQTSDGVHCREFTQTIWVEGRAERAHGTACREPDGSWWIDS